MNKPLSALSRRQFIVGVTGSSLVLGLGSSLGGCQPDQAASDLATAGAVMCSPRLFGSKSIRQVRF